MAVKGWTSSCIIDISFQLCLVVNERATFTASGFPEVALAAIVFTDTRAVS